VQIVGVRLAAIGAIAGASSCATSRARRAPCDQVGAQLWFRETGPSTPRIYDRRRMPAGLALAGPVVIESLESTILVPPRWHARMNEDGFVLLQHDADGKS